ncbi:MAG: hypothetical protein U0992_23360 [Planctomycetaceae bacterium]
MRPAKDGFVPEFVNFDGNENDLPSIPDRYEFQLARGTELSGTVVDEAECRSPGVTVDVMVEIREPAWTKKPDPMISTWLTDTDYTAGPVVTNTDGRWSINNAPAPSEDGDYVFRLTRAPENTRRISDGASYSRNRGLRPQCCATGRPRSFCHAVLS